MAIFKIDRTKTIYYTIINERKLKRTVRPDGFTAIRIQHNSSWSGMQFIPNGLNLAVGEQINLSFSIQSVGYKSNISFYAMIFNSEGTRLQGAVFGIES